MYKLTLGSINELKYSNTDTHGLFSGTIETDRVVLVDGDGKYLQVDGNFGTDLKNGLVRTYSASRDEAEIAYKIATTDATTYAAVFVYDGIMKLQSDFADVDAFIEYLVDELHLIEVQGYDNPKYQLKAATIKTAGSGYTEESVDVTVPGQAGDTAGVVTVTIAEGACSAAEIKTAGSYETMVASQDLTVGTGNGKITVTMETISEAKSANRSAPAEEPEEEKEPEAEEPKVVEIKSGKKGKSEPEVIEETIAEPEEESKDEEEPKTEEESEATEEPMEEVKEDEEKVNFAEPEVKENSEPEEEPEAK